ELAVDLETRSVRAGRCSGAGLAVALTPAGLQAGAMVAPWHFESDALTLADSRVRLAGLPGLSLHALRAGGVSDGGVATLTAAASTGGRGRTGVATGSGDADRFAARVKLAALPAGSIAALLSSRVR